MNQPEHMIARRHDTELGILRTLLLAVFMLAIPVALITTTVRAVISEAAVYDYSVREFDAPNAADIPEEELIQANGQIRDYLVSGPSGSLAVRVTDNDGDDVLLFNAREVAHMKDVRDLVQTMFLAQQISVALVLALAVLMIALWPVRVLAAGLLYGAALTGVLVVAAAILAMSGFDAAWSQFHGIAFTNDLWQLDPDTDHLIQMFPEEFWFQVTSLIGLAVLLEAILVAGLATLCLIFFKSDLTSAKADRDRPSLPGRAGHSRLPGPNPRASVRP
jgi:integral membrane protein (TIGR01906 family)